MSGDGPVTVFAQSFVPPTQQTFANAELPKDVAPPPVFGRNLSDAFQVNPFFIAFAKSDRLSGNTTNTMLPNVCNSKSSDPDSTLRTPSYNLQVQLAELFMETSFCSELGTT